LPRLRFSQVDVFAGSPLAGNPVAVVHDADGLTDEQMTAFARWTNLSETTFLLTPQAQDADYRLRIFTPATELPFAGHPTLGSAHAWLQYAPDRARERPLVQECGAGLVSVRRLGENLAFAAPRCVRTGPVDELTLERVAAATGTSRARILSHQWVDNGPGWLAIELATVAELHDLHLNTGLLAGLDVGVFAFAEPGADHLYEVRALVADYMSAEDPVTGSLNASLAQWLRGEGRVPERYMVRQGRAIGYDGVIAIEDDGTDIWVAGSTRTTISGEVDFG